VSSSREKMHEGAGGFDIITLSSLASEGTEPEGEVRPFVLV